MWTSWEIAGGPQRQGGLGFPPGPNLAVRPSPRALLPRASLSHLWSWINTALFCRATNKSGNNGTSGPFLCGSHQPVLLHIVYPHSKLLFGCRVWPLVHQLMRKHFISLMQTNYWPRKSSVSVVSLCLSLCNYLDIPLHFTYTSQQRMEKGQNESTDISNNKHSSQTQGSGNKTGNPSLGKLK